MARFSLIVVLFLGIASIALADAPRSRVTEAERLLAAGEASAALEAFRELQVEYPDDPAVQFGAACALLMQGTNAVAAQAPEEALAAYGSAQAAFRNLRTGAPVAGVRAQAAFNEGNALLYAAELLDDERQFEEKVQAYRNAIQAFESALGEEPGHGGAEQNRDHARYRLKLLLQNPPEQDEQDQLPPPDQQPPQFFSLFRLTDTDIPGAEAVRDDEDIVRLVPPGGGR